MTGPLIFLKVANGGWVVKQVPDRFHPNCDVTVGAFSNTADLLNWFTVNADDVRTPVISLDEPVERP